MVYTSESLALAALEILAHLGRRSTLASYSRCAVHFDEALVSSLDRSLLPASWRAYPAPAELQFIGNSWIAGEASAVLEVPSALVETESNYLINPLHPDFGSLIIKPPKPFDCRARVRLRREPAPPLEA
jgi:RES domain-containing protein